MTTVSDPNLKRTQQGLFKRNICSEFKHSQSLFTKPKNKTKKKSTVETRKHVRPQLDTNIGQLILEALTWQMGTRNTVLLESRHSPKSYFGESTYLLHMFAKSQFINKVCVFPWSAKL